MSREPLINIAMITAVVASFIGLLRAFGVPITPEQQDAINQFLIAAGPVAVALIARGYVTPTADPKAKNTRGETVTLVPADGSQLAKKG